MYWSSWWSCYVLRFQGVSMVSQTGLVAVRQRISVKAYVCLESPRSTITLVRNGGPI